MRPYYPQANGNWDGAIIHSLIAMAIFTDNRPLYDNAVNHFKHAPVNGSIFKYIYPNGQCQESPRDQGHVQLGIGEFAGAAQVAYTQGTDLFSLAGNRIALSPPTGHRRRFPTAPAPTPRQGKGEVRVATNLGERSLATHKGPS